MYQSKIKSTIVIDEKTGDVKLSEFDVSVDGYKNKRKLRKAKNAYNSDKLIDYKKDDWPKGIWYYMFRDYLKRLITWKRISKKK